MRRTIFLNIFFTLVVVTIGSYRPASAAGNRKITAVTSGVSIDHTTPDMHHLPARTGLKATHIIKVPVMEELAKIHRFHRERLRRMKKHHHKCWISAKLLLLLCHLALLVCAYLHATH